MKNNMVRKIVALVLIMVVAVACMGLTTALADTPPQIYMYYRENGEYVKMWSTSEDVQISPDPDTEVIIGFEAGVSLEAHQFLRVTEDEVLNYPCQRERRTEEVFYVLKAGETGILSIKVGSEWKTWLITTSESETPDPQEFSLSYTQNGVELEEKLNCETFFACESVIADSGSVVDIRMRRNPETGFELNEILFFKNGQGTALGNRSNVTFRLNAGESGVAVVNCGTDEDPNWVPFVIETTAITQ